MRGILSTRYQSTAATISSNSSLNSLTSFNEKLKTINIDQNIESNISNLNDEIDFENFKKNKEKKLLMMKQSLSNSALKKNFSDKNVNQNDDENKNNKQQKSNTFYYEGKIYTDKKNENLLVENDDDSNDDDDENNKKKILSKNNSNSDFMIFTDDDFNFTEIINNNNKNNNNNIAINKIDDISPLKKNLPPKSLKTFEPKDGFNFLPKSPYKSMQEKNKVFNSGVPAGAGLSIAVMHPRQKTRDGRYRAGLSSKDIELRNFKSPPFVSTA
jgi:hypothetical protein